MVDTSPTGGDATMIKVRVEWHHRCPDCGTEVVSDYFEETGSPILCAWCGRVVEVCHSEADEKTREYLKKAVKRIEEKVNSSAAVKA